MAPKGTYPRWTYESLNLLLTCQRCNTTEKESFDPVAIPAGETADTVDYSACSFKIFHPYLDKASEHFEGGYDGGAHEPSPIRALTEKGLRTIELFTLDSWGRYANWLLDYYLIEARNEQWTPEMLRRKLKVLRELGN